MRRPMIVTAAAMLLAAIVPHASASTPGPDVRVTQDAGAGYVSAYTLGTGLSYTDPTLQECSVSKGRQNEPAVAVDPRDHCLFTRLDQPVVLVQQLL